MKVCHFTEFEGLLEGGITTSIRHQRKALRRNGIEYTENPSEGFDILHLNVPGPESFLQFVKAKRQGKPVVMHSHVTGEDFRNSFRFSNALSPFVGVYTSFLYNRADVVVAPSTYNRKVLRGNGVKTPVEVVSNGVDAERLEGC
ncbi:MAG: glycosyltransferase, partial [Candidatus Nanohaloarchaea archaeon]